MKSHFAWLAAAFLAAAIPAAVSAQSAMREADARAYIDVARKVLPSVVNITIEPKAGNPEADLTEEERIRQYFNQRRSGVDGPSLDTVSGSGVVIERRDQLAYVITNNHVVDSLDDSQDLKLTFHQREEGKTDYGKTTVISGDGARVIGRDQLSDLAVIEFRVPDGMIVEPIPFADSDTVEIGEQVLALGNPLNLNHTVTRGIVSAKSRYLGSRISLDRLLQTDAVIQPGNSGGPLVNLDGNIVGINNAILSQTGMWMGTSFAIPSNDAKRVVGQLLNEGRVLRGYIGVSMEDMGNPSRRELVKLYGLDGAQGILVKYIVPNSPADIAGVNLFDVITEVDGVKVASPDDLLQIITSKPVDSPVELAIVRLNDDRSPNRIRLTAAVTERPNEKVIRGLHPNNAGGPIVPQFNAENEEPGAATLGIELLPQKDGLLVIGLLPGRAGFRAGVKEGDSVVSLNGRPVLEVDGFLAAMNEPTAEGHVLVVKREDQEQRLVMPLRRRDPALPFMLDPGATAPEPAAPDADTSPSTSQDNTPKEP